MESAEFWKHPALNTERRISSNEAAANDRGKGVKLTTQHNEAISFNEACLAPSVSRQCFMITSICKVIVSELTSQALRDILTRV